MSFHLEKGSGIPAYMQIANWVEGRIRSGEFAPGSRLPSERLLSVEAGVARATVKNAYKELEGRERIRIMPGSGAYVNTLPNQEHRDEARDAVLHTLGRLRRAGVEQQRILSTAKEVAWARLQRKERPRLAWIGCCPELARFVAQQIEVECGFSVEQLLLQRVLTEPELLTKEYFHTIATSIEHYEEVCETCGEVLERIGISVERVVLSFSPEVMTALLSIPPAAEVAVAYESRQFISCVQGRLAEMGVQAKLSYYPLRETDCNVADQVHESWMILPPLPDSDRESAYRLLADIRRRGTKPILFSNEMDFGSIRHLKHKFQSLG